MRRHARRPPRDVQGSALTGGGNLARLAAEAAASPTPGAALRKLTALRRELEEFERAQVARALGEGASFASIARNLGLSRQAVHRRYRELAPPPDDVPALLPTPEVRLVLRYAREEAAMLGAALLGGEHLLLGLLRASRLRPLEDAGVTLEKVRAQVEAMSPHSPLFRHVDAHTDIRAVLAGPAAEAVAHGSRTIEAEHVLLAILRDPGSGAARTLRAVGADPRTVCAEVEALVEPWLA
jgi:transposase-like protein